MWEPPNWSYASDIVRIVVAETYYPKPTISLRPSVGVALGGAVTIQCRGRHQNVRFLLYKVGNPNTLQGVEPAGDMAEFSIRNMSRRDTGTYSCRYSTKSDPPVWSEPSDPVELVVAELPAPGPSISVSPSGVIALGGAVTIRCQCRCKARRLLLCKDGVQIRELDVAGDGGEFTIPSARWEDSGVYSCQSRSRTEPPNWSDPSDYVQIVVAELRYPKPSISLRPTGGVALGGAVTVRCQGSHQNMRFLLHKVGNRTALQDTEPAGNVAEFPIRNNQVLQCKAVITAQLWRKKQQTQEFPIAPAPHTELRHLSDVGRGSRNSVSRGGYRFNKVMGEGVCCSRGPARERGTPTNGLVTRKPSSVTASSGQWEEDNGLRREDHGDLTSRFQPEGREGRQEEKRPK
ncbi:Immunoglobulin superfamily member 1 [Chelonia mydas]|nr:Immunoglobulin superfamily member 1 [Chelonia mydas]